MAGKTTPLAQGQTATVGANGIGRVEFGPDGLNNWHVLRIAVLASSNTLEPQFRVYVDSEAPTNLLGSTYTGSGDSSDENLYLRPGQKLIGVWSSADVGAKVTMSVFGTKTPL